MSVLKWADVQTKPAYKSLSATDKGLAAQQYFDDVVAPQVGKNTDLAEVARQFSSYSGFEMSQTDNPVMQEDTGDQGSQVVAGLNTAIDTTQATGYGLAAMAGDMIDSDGLRQWGMDGYKRNMEESKHNGLRVSDYEDVHNAGDAVDYVAGGIGQVLPSVATMLATGGVGGLIAKYGAKKSIQKLADKMMKDGLSKEEAKNNATKMIVRKGQAIGGFAGSMGMSTGEIYGDVAQDGAEGAGAIASSMTGGALSGVLDALPVMAVAKKFGFAGELTDKITGNIAARFGKGAATTGLQEAGTEAVQQLIQETTKAFILEKNLPDNIGHQMINSALLGFVGGGAIGGVSSVAAGNQETDPLDNEKQVKLEPSQSEMNAKDAESPKVPESQATIGLQLLEM
ncbi:MAG: hypothetical protein R8M45_06870, partial [Ghiorsea sp.]